MGRELKNYENLVYKNYSFLLMILFPERTHVES